MVFVFKTLHLYQILHIEKGLTASERSLFSYLNQPFKMYIYTVHRPYDLDYFNNTQNINTKHKMDSPKISRSQ